MTVGVTQVPRTVREASLKPTVTSVAESKPIVQWEFVYTFGFTGIENKC